MLRDVAGAPSKWVVECESYAVEMTEMKDENYTQRPSQKNMTGAPIALLDSNESAAARKAFQEIRTFDTEESTAM